MTTRMSPQTRARQANGASPGPRNRVGRRHVLDLDDFTVQEIEEVFQNTDAMREVMNRGHQESPNAAGQDSDNAVYGGEHSHPRFIRAGWKDSERRRL